MLTCYDDVVGCQRHELAHDVIPERQVQDAKRAQVDRHPVAKQKAPHKLFVYVMARRLVNHVLALEGYVYVGLIRLIPVLQAIDKV